MRAAARDTVVSRFALDDLLPLHMQLVRDLAAGHVPPPVAEKIKQVSLTAPYEKAMWRAN